MYLNWTQLSRVNLFTLFRASHKGNVLELAYKGLGEPSGKFSGILQADG